MLLRAGHAGDALERFADARLGLTVPDPVLEYFVSLATDQTQRDAASSSAVNAAPPLVIPELANELTASSPPPAGAGTGPTLARCEEKAARKLPRRP
jgi:hypothetical protein